MSETRKYIETTANNGIVSVDIEHSHAATHLREQPGLWELTQEVLRRSHIVTPPDKDAVFETDMGRTVGEMDLVDVEPSDWEGPKEHRIRWARRMNRETWTPLVVRDKRPSTRFITVVLKHLDIARLDPTALDPKLLEPDIADRQHHDLYTTYIGRKTPSLPGDRYETGESLPYWLSHALIWGTQAVQEDTVRYDSPWPVDEQ
ncbi:MAG TPA: hypothetical protein VK502_01985 [Candidatus Saccharimonadales bacterium]|nr:hypothetical protein [Candidatus Saccharimonadales bacterium]